ncbi:MAG TPA: hypothetical protein PK547_01940 [Candidatus Paceibacterota bacterium]|nr:hypothetical protein [Candidatus Paceibacterota bacterium]
MSKKILLGVGLVIILMGIWGILSNYISALWIAYDPLWHSIFKLILGGFCVFVALKDKTA